MLGAFLGVLASRPPMIPAARHVTELHDRCLSDPRWPRTELADGPAAAEAGGDGAWRWNAANHLFNSRLWAEEDLARRTQVGDAEIARNKRQDRKSTRLNSSHSS